MSRGRFSVDEVVDLLDDLALALAEFQGLDF